MDKNSHFKVNGQGPSKLVGRLSSKMDRNKNHYILRHTGAHQVTIKTCSHNSHFGTRIQGIGTNYTHLCLIQPLLSQVQSTQLQEKLVAYPVERK